jgi:hypothetical protein
LEGSKASGNLLIINTRAEIKPYPNIFAYGAFSGVGAELNEQSRPKKLDVGW